MDTRLREIIEKQKAHPGDVQNQARLERKFERLDTTPTKRANVLAMIYYPEWVQREIIWNKDLNGAGVAPDMKSILFQQDLNPVAVDPISVIELAHANERDNAETGSPGSTKKILDQIRVIKTTPTPWGDGPVTGYAHPILLPQLQIIDYSQTNRSIQRLFEDIAGLSRQFPFQGKLRKVILPALDPKELTVELLETMFFINPDEWEIRIPNFEIKGEDTIVFED